MDLRSGTDAGAPAAAFHGPRAEPGPRRHVPRWSELRPFVRLQPPVLGARARAQQAVTLSQLRELARRRTPRAIFDYVDGGAEAELSLARTRRAFSDVEFRPRVLRDVAEIRLATRVLDRPASMPVFLAPTGFTRMMQYEGEPAVARAARSAGLPYALSTMGTTSAEGLAAAVPGGRHWFQLYLWRDRAASREMVSRAADAGFEALVLTVDTPVAGARLRDVRNGLTIPPALTARTVADMARHPSWWLNLLTTEPLTFASFTRTDGGLASMMDRVLDPSTTVHDLEWLRSVWPGPLVVKGIQGAADARIAVDAGATAVVLSNHGGRQLDRSPTPLRELRGVVEEVGGEAEVYLDGGITSGADVVASLALGATACGIGRAYLFGLMAAGEAGVARVLEILRAEMERTMRLIGVTDVADLEPGCVRQLP